jgi:hypothetical protein
MTARRLVTFRSGMRGPVPAFSLALVASLALFAAGSGCGPAAPEFDKAAEYTPASLAKELTFRYRGLSDSGKARRKASAVSTASKVFKPETGKAAVDESSKKAPAKSVDDLAEETASKMLLIKGMPKAEVLKKVEQTVVEDSELAPKDKTLIIEALDAATGAK